jgi:hypothetical protein
MEFSTLQGNLKQRLLYTPACTPQFVTPVTSSVTSGWLFSMQKFATLAKIFSRVTLDAGNIAPGFQE